MTGRTVSVVVPARNEATVVGRMLDALLSDAESKEFDVVVVSNGSTDSTTDEAHSRGINAIELDIASKTAALKAGDEVAQSFPRLYIDADVVLDTASARELVGTLRRDPSVLLVAPERVLDLSECSPVVKAYYRVWSALPAVQEGLYGRGVVGVSAAGYRRLAARPDLLGDDLFVHTRFTASERQIVNRARVIVAAPRTVRALVRRRSRVIAGNRQFTARTDADAATAGQSMLASFRVLGRTPRSWLDLIAFLVISGWARLLAVGVASDTSTWNPDATTRS